MSFYMYCDKENKYLLNGNGINEIYIFIYINICLVLNLAAGQYRCEAAQIQSLTRVPEQGSYF